MSNLYKEYKWSELIKNEIRRYGYNIRENSYLAKLLEIAKKDEKRNPKVSIIDRSLLREIIKCVLTGENIEGKKNINLYDIIDKYIRPSNSLYKGYKNKEFAKHEIITELGTIYIRRF
jgi:hypothetical protein